MRPEIAMLSAATALAIVIAATSHFFWRRREELRTRARSRRSRDAIIRAIQYRIAELGRDGEAGARRLFGEAVPEHSIDLTSWAEAFAAQSGMAAASRLLEDSFRVAIATGLPIPPQQYAALLQLAFALGFHTDSLTRLREKYKVEVTDFSRNRLRRQSMLHSDVSYDTIQMSQRLLGVRRPFRKRELAAAYRRSAAIVHPDRFHESDPEARDEAVARFLELARAYEQLLPYCEED